MKKTSLMNALGTSEISNCVSVSVIFKDPLTLVYLIEGISLGSLTMLGVGFLVYKKKKM